MKDEKEKQPGPEQRFSRRSFLMTSGLAGVGLLKWPCTKAWAEQPVEKGCLPSLGLALGAGGANGLAHIPMLEALDELGIRPKVIAGTSIGAIMGVLYASGLSGADMRRIALDLFDTDQGLLGGWWDRITGTGLLELLRPGIGDGGLLDAGGVMEFIRKKIRVKNFEELAVPMKVVAADFWKSQQVVFESGEIIPALNASMAVPGLFAPVSYQDRLLVDGATVNPVPFDLLLGVCDVTVAVDISGKKTPDRDGRPSYLDTIFSTFEIMQEAIMKEKLKRCSPDMYVRPDIVDVRLMQFNKINKILDQAEPAKSSLKNSLEEFIALRSCKDENKK